MVFPSNSQYERPVRLKESTRAFAWDSLHHKWGLDTAKTKAVLLDTVPDYASLSPLDRYDTAIRKIATEAPIRICPHELISGAATLGLAIYHKVPATIGGEFAFESISHLTVDFETVLKRGINGIRKDIENALSLHTDPEKIRFLESCLSTVESFSVWHARYLETLKDLPEYAANYQNLCRVPMEPAADFYEAVQSIWFTFAFIRLTGNWPGIGRIDLLLGDYLKKDLQSGKQTLDSAREILAHFFIKGCEWITGENRGSGDAQHYQNILLAGCDADGNDVTNEVSYLVLDVVEELGISDYPISVRLNKNTDAKFLRRCAEVLRFGGGILAFYGEETVLKALTQYGYPAADAWKFANDGCWEVQIPGKTYFQYWPFDSLQILQQDTLGSYADGVAFADFDTLYRRFSADLYKRVHDFIVGMTGAFVDRNVPPKDMKWKPNRPCTVVSVFEQGCIEKGLSYLEGGPVYNVLSPHIGGFPDTVNALYAIKKMVFDDRLISLGELTQILKENWAGHEDLRRLAMTRYAYYGNGNEEVDKIAADIINDFALACAESEGVNGFRFPAGISTFGRQLEWAPDRLATPHGHHAGDVLAANCSPTPGSDREGATAVIRSYCRADLSKMVTGAALDLKLLPSSVEGEDGIEAIMALLRGFEAMGGCFMQPDVADRQILIDAQQHPEDYQTLSVRVSGWNARFITLNKQWQDMVIDEYK